MLSIKRGRIAFNLISTPNSNSALLEILHLIRELENGLEDATKVEEGHLALDFLKIAVGGEVEVDCQGRDELGARHLPFQQLFQLRVAFRSEYLGELNQ